MAMLIMMNDNYNDNDDLKGHDDNDENVTNVDCDGWYKWY